MVVALRASVPIERFGESVFEGFDHTEFAAAEFGIDLREDRGFGSAEPNGVGQDDQSQHGLAVVA